MNWYYVRDGERIGPIPEEQLKDLHALGRIGADPLVWREGMAEWQAFSLHFPTDPGAPPPPSAAPPAGPPVPDRPAPGTGGSADSGFPNTGVRGDPAALVAVDYEVRIGECLSQAWRLFTGPKFGVLFGAGAVINVIYLGATYVPIIGVAAPIFMWVLFAGLYQYYLGHIRGSNPPFDHVFSGFRCQLGALVVIALIQIAACFVCMIPALIALLIAAVAQEEAILVMAGVLGAAGILPMIYLYVSWGFAPILCLDKGLGPWTALETSRKVAQKHWFSVFLFFVVITLIALGGMLLLCIGVLFTFPYASLAWTFFYHDIFDREETKPKALL